MITSLYLEAFVNSESIISVPVSSAIAVYVARFCSMPSNRVVFIKIKSPSADAKTVKMDRDVFFGAQVSELEDAPIQIRHCTRPSAIANGGRIIHSGLCSVLRLIAKTDDRFVYLLGDRRNCLKACAEVSAWTKFCEVQMPSAVERYLELFQEDSNVSCEIRTIPDELFQLEYHFSTPPVVSNIRKRQQEIVKHNESTKETQINNPSGRTAQNKYFATGSDKQAKNYSSTDDDQNMSLNNSIPANDELVSCDSPTILEHIYVEGIDFRLTDLVLISCVTLILNKWKDNFSMIQPYFKKIFSWCYRVLALPTVRRTMTDVGFPVLDFACITPQLVNLNLSESGWQIRTLPQICNPVKKKTKFSQKAIEEMFLKVKSIGISPKVVPHPAGEVRLAWKTYPAGIHPKDGDLPQKRLDKKCQQLENLATAVSLLAAPGDIIVDFCSGGGHLGLLLAFLLPECHVVLVENKEESLSRALARIELLQLQNVITYQSNLDYFDAPFDIGVCLHGCGVATDLVLEKCQGREASFVVCPCCYGSIEDTHTMKYPRSSLFDKAGFRGDFYAVIAHAADQTQQGIVQADQGRLAMQFIDSDRLARAEELGYQTMLCTLSPPSCSPKNDLLVGVAPNRAFKGERPA